MILLNLLEFIKENKFVLNKDGKWYKTDIYPRITYKESELIELFKFLNHSS